MVQDAAAAQSALYAELKATKRLPSPPGTALRILDLCRQENADLQEIADTIMSDSVLASRLLRFANSPLAGISRQVVSIREAILLLGLRTVKLTALGFSVAMPGQEPSCAGFDLKKFWASSCLRAVTARRLAAQFPGVDREEAFTAALFASLGQLVLVLGLGPRYAPVLEAVRGGQSLSDAEHAVLGCDHVAMGALILREWAMPDLLVQAVASQAGPFEPSHMATPSDRLAQMIRLSNALMPCLASASPGGIELPDATRCLIENALGCNTAAWTAISQEILANYREMAALYNIELDGPAAAMDLYAEAQEQATRVGMVAQLERAKTQRDNEDLLRRATTDPLTGIANRAKFDERIRLETAGLRRDHGHFALLIFDIDFFKKFNDQHGHQVGDLVLKRVATAAKNVLRDVDLVARYGGEEFAVLAPHTDRKGACFVAARIQRCVEELRIDLGGARLAVTISSGLVVTSDYPQPPTAEQLIADADKQLYLSKDAGRNTWSYRGCSASKVLRTPAPQAASVAASV